MLAEEKEEEETRELTFRPILAKHSLKILRKARQEGRDVRVRHQHDIDREAEQAAKQRRQLRRRQAAGSPPLQAGHEEETFEPEILWRSGRYAAAKGPARKPVYARLYESALARTARAHRHVVLGFTTSLRNCAARKFETAPLEAGSGAAVWVADVQRERERRRARAEQALLQAADEPVINIIAYHKRYDGLVRRLHPGFVTA